MSVLELSILNRAGKTTERVAISSYDSPYCHSVDTVQSLHFGMRHTTPSQTQPMRLCDGRHMFLCLRITLCCSCSKTAVSLITAVYESQHYRSAPSRPSTTESRFISAENRSAWAMASSASSTMSSQARLLNIAIT